MIPTYGIDLTASLSPVPVLLDAAATALVLAHAALLGRRSRPSPKPTPLRLVARRA